MSINSTSIIFHQSHIMVFISHGISRTFYSSLDLLDSGPFSYHHICSWKGMRVVARSNCIIIKCPSCRVISVSITRRRLSARPASRRWSSSIRPDPRYFRWLFLSLIIHHIIIIILLHHSIAPRAVVVRNPLV